MKFYAAHPQENIFQLFMKSNEMKQGDSLGFAQLIDRQTYMVFPITQQSTLLVFPTLVG